MAKLQYCLHVLYLWISGRVNAERALKAMKLF